MINIDMAMAYLGFVEERHKVWEARQHDKCPPWTDDPIINSRKFTNVFRVLDYGSQFLVRELLDENLSEREALARCFLYRHTNLPSAWQHVRAELGEWPSLDNLAEVELVWKLHRLNGEAVFSGAYMIYPQSSEKGTDKVESIIRLTRRLFSEGHMDDIVPDFLAASSQADRFAALRRNKGVADFMSMQILTDYGYSAQCGEDREEEFVVLGPGALRGCKALDPDSRPTDTFDWAVEAVRSMPECPVIEPHDGVLREPSLMDIQNTLCEFSKYARFMSRPYREQPYEPAHPGVPSDLVLPKHWNQ